MMEPRSHQYAKKKGIILASAPIGSSFKFKMESPKFAKNNFNFKNALNY